MITKDFRHVLGPYGSAFEPRRFARTYGQLGTLKLAILVCQMGTPVWLAVKYSLTYQKVQSSTGSTVMLV